MALDPIAAAPFAEIHRPLASLDKTGLENLFHCWRGASGRRYICWVYSVDEPPAFDCRLAVVAAVRRNPAGAAIAFVFQPGPEDEGDDFRVWTQKARKCGANEWHVHLLAGTPSARDFAARDLAPGGVRIAA